MKHPCVERIAGTLGVAIDHDRLQTLAEWLATEAIVAGALGPNEHARIWERHICDSLAYALPVGGIPSRALDVGTGAGLPGLPLAVLWPDTEWTLLDRSGRRVDLVGRAVRILGLTTVSVRQGEPETLGERWPLVVSRATFPANTLVRRLLPVIGPDGQAVVGLHRGSGPPELPPAVAGAHFELKPQEVLDPPSWFLMIRPCE